MYADYAFAIICDKKIKKIEKILARGQLQAQQGIL
jgi:hypothetical protein